MNVLKKIALIGAIATISYPSPQTVGVNVTTATLADSGEIPPDSDGAVGPTQFITAVNGRIRTSSKFTGAPDGALDTTLSNFFSSVTSGNGTSDPKILYDRSTSKWYVVCITTPNRSNSILLAVSNSSTITNATIWSFFSLQQDLIPPAGDSSHFFDYPTLGIDINALYIGGNIFSSGTGSFIHSTGVVIQKSSVQGSGPIVANAFRGIAGTAFFTPQGVSNDDPSATQGYFVGNVNTSNLGLVIISNPGSTNPTASSVINMPIPTVAEPVNVPAQGSSIPLDAGDIRLSQAHIIQNQLWIAHNIGLNSSGGTSSPDRTGTRWYQYDMTTPTSPSLTQSGTIYDSSVSNPLFYWMPSLIMSGQGHMAMGFSIAGQTHYADAGTVGRLSSDPSGTVESIVQYTTSTTAYNEQGFGTSQRWGDFSITTLDPNDNMTIWTIQEWCSNTNQWGVQAAQLLAPPPAEVSSATPPIVTRGLASVLVTINGSSINGEGFYEPGPSFANHLTALVSGGVIVNSVTYVSPIQIILDLNTQVATSGVKTIVIKNPDGQTKFGNVLIVI